MAKYCIAVQEIIKGKSNSILFNTIINKMIPMGEIEWGLGPGLEGDDELLLFKHSGKNEGFTNNMLSSPIKVPRSS